MNCEDPLAPRCLSRAFPLQIMFTDASHGSCKSGTIYERSRCDFQDGHLHVQSPRYELDGTTNRESHADGVLSYI